MRQNAQDYLSMVTALRRAHTAYPRFRVLWKVVRTDQNRQTFEVPFIRECDWLPSVAQVYEHPATKIVVHHGGGEICCLGCRNICVPVIRTADLYPPGNTVNEVIWHGLQHLVIPQWSDTYDWGA